MLCAAERFSTRAAEPDPVADGADGELGARRDLWTQEIAVRPAAPSDHALAVVCALVCRVVARRAGGPLPDVACHVKESVRRLSFGERADRRRLGKAVVEVEERRPAAAFGAADGAA